MKSLPHKEIDHTGFSLATAVQTPFDENGELRLELVEQQAAWVADSGAHAVYVAGTAGEGASLGTEERKALLSRWCEVAGDQLGVFAHIGHTSLPEARPLAAHAQQVGADAISAVPPYFHRAASADALVDFLRPMAAAAPELPFVYYHIPGMTGAQPAASDVLQACLENVPTFAGIKFAANDLPELQRCLALGGERVRIYLGNAAMALAARSVGVGAAIGSAYNFAAPLYRQLLRHAANGEPEAAFDCQLLAQEAIRTIGRYGGELPGFKAATAIAGLDCGPCRPPLRSPSREQRDQLAAELDQIGFLQAVGAT